METMKEADSGSLIRVIIRPEVFDFTLTNWGIPG